MIFTNGMITDSQESGLEQKLAQQKQFSRTPGHYVLYFFNDKLLDLEKSGHEGYLL